MWWEDRVVRCLHPAAARHSSLAGTRSWRISTGSLRRTAGSQQLSCWRARPGLGRRRCGEARSSPPPIRTSSYRRNLWRPRRSCRMRLSDLLEPCAADVLPGLPRPQRRARGALLLAEPEADPQPRAVAAGFLSVLRELAREQPVLVALDDVHWLDTSSRAVLDFAFRRLRNEAVAVLISARADAEERSLAHGPAFEGERITRVQLGGLDASAVQTLLRERLGLALTRPTLLQVVGASEAIRSSRSSSGGRSTGALSRPASRLRSRLR